MASESLDDLYRRTSINPYIPGFCERNGYILGPGYDQIKDKLDNFEVRDTDVWVCTYPKAGTTWTQEMVWLLVNNLDYEGAKTRLISRFPFLEMQMLFEWDALEKFQGTAVPYPSSNSIDYADKLTVNPRCVKSHLPWDLLPKSIRNKEKTPKIINVIRNPKDLCVSYYHHSRLLQFYNGTFEEFVQLFINDKLFYSPYWKFLESYWEQKNEPNVLIIKYEDMKRDLKSQIVKVANFLNKTINDDELEKLANHLSFDSMKKNPNINFQPMRNPNVDADADFIRKGIIGDFKNIMSPETIAEFDRWIEKKNRFGVTF